MAKCLRRVWSKGQLSKSRLNQKMLGFYYMSKIIFVFPLVVVINQRVFLNWYHCFNPEVRGQIAGLQSCGLLLGMTQAPVSTHSQFPNSTVLLHSRIHLNSEHLSLDLMWYLVWIPQDQCYCIVPSFSPPYVLHFCPR